MKLKPRHFTPTAILTLMASVSSFFASAQTEQKVTEIMIVEDKAPDTVNVNGKKTSVYELQSLDSEPEYPGGVSGLMSSGRILYILKVRCKTTFRAKCWLSLS